MTTQALPGFRVALPAKWVELDLDPDTRPAAFGSTFLRGTIGQAGALAGRSGVSEHGVRLTGAAMRANQLRRFGEISTTFADDVSRTALPRVGHALTRFRPLELPARQMLDLCPSAARAANIGANVGAAISDVYSVGEQSIKATAALGGSVPLIWANEGQEGDPS